MRLVSAALFYVAWVRSAGGSQVNLLARASSHRLGVNSVALDGSEAEAQLGIGASMANEPTCDVLLSDPLCYAGGRQALLPGAVPSGLVGYWSFDSEVASDSSGNGNHGVTEVTHGPAPVGSGHSAVFTETFMMVPNSALLSVADFTYSFWIYLVDDGSKAQAGRSATWCTLLRKGIRDVHTDQFADAPALLFSDRTGHLRAQITTSVKGTQDGESFESNARILPNRWMHIAMVHHSSRSSLLLYVNGILDNVMTTQGKLVTNDYPLYVGGDPFTAGQCGFTVYMDELKAYSYAVPPHQFQAEAAPALGGADPSFVRLGCASCSLADAAKSCPANRHLCTATELHTGGYQVARSMGWLAASTHVWTHAAVSKGAAAEMGGKAPEEPLSGLALCCEGAP